MKKVWSVSILIFFCTIMLPDSSKGQSGPTLNHIAVYVQNLQKSTVFYRDVIGLDTIPEPFKDGKHTWFRIGEHSQLHIIEGAESIISHQKSTHNCFTVPSVEAFVKKLEQYKIRYENVPGELNKITVRADGVKQIYFQDPDNYWVEINDDTY